MCLACCFSPAAAQCLASKTGWVYNYYNLILSVPARQGRDSPGGTSVSVPWWRFKYVPCTGESRQLTESVESGHVVAFADSMCQWRLLRSTNQSVKSLVSLSHSSAMAAALRGPRSAVSAYTVITRVGAAGLWCGSVSTTETPSTGLRHPSFNHCRI